MADERKECAGHLALSSFKAHQHLNLSIPFKLSQFVIHDLTKVIQENLHVVYLGQCLFIITVSGRAAEIQLTRCLLGKLQVSSLLRNGVLLMFLNIDCSGKSSQVKRSSEQFHFKFFSYVYLLIFQRSIGPYKVFDLRVR